MERTQSQEPLPTFVNRMVRSLKGAYSSFRNDEDQAKLYVREIGQMTRDYGRQRTEKGIEEAIRIVPDFAPSIATLRDFAARLPNPNHKHGSFDPKDPYKPVCVDCGGSRWRYRGDGSVERCNCERFAAPTPATREDIERLQKTAKAMGKAKSLNKAVGLPEPKRSEGA